MRSILNQPDANLEGFLIIKGKEYEIIEFNTDLIQPTDIKGEPQGYVRGGFIKMSIAQLPDNLLYYWAGNQWIKYDGEIVFRNKTSSAPMKIKFTNAYCVQLIQNVSETEGSVTEIAISSETLDINGFSIDNQWNN